MGHIILYIAAGAGIVFGAVVMAGAPAVTQEMAGLLLILIGVVSLGFAEAIRLMQNAAEEIITAVKSGGSTGDE